MSVVLKPEHRETLDAIDDAVSSVSDASAEFLDPASEVSIVEDEIVKEKKLRVVVHLTSKEDRVRLTCNVSKNFLKPTVCQSLVMYGPPKWLSKPHWVHLNLPVPISRSLQILRNHMWPTRMR